MVGEGQLDRGDVEQRLVDAATDSGLGDGEARATIQSGLDAGIEAANEFDVDAKGRVVPSPRNIILALKELGVSISYDVFQGHAEIQGLEGFGPALDDAAIARLWLMAEKRFGLRTQKDRFWTVVEDAARGKAFHPVRDYLDSL
jgi:hypothetical protein